MARAQNSRFLGALGFLGFLGFLGSANPALAGFTCVAACSALAVGAKQPS